MIEISIARTLHDLLMDNTNIAIYETPVICKGRSRLYHLLESIRKQKRETGGWEVYQCWIVLKDTVILIPTEANKNITKANKLFKQNLGLVAITAGVTQEPLLLGLICSLPILHLDRKPLHLVCPKLINFLIGPLPYKKWDNAVCPKQAQHLSISPV